MRKDLIRKQLRFFGNVQGVGFRYTANSIAQSLGITGFVYNDFDGSVLMEAQGTKAEIENLISRLNDGMFISIDRIEKWKWVITSSKQNKSQQEARER